MLPFKRTFESDKQQLRELNSRLAQYLSRTKQLEQENVHLITEINQLRRARAAGREPSYQAEMRDMRRMVAQLSFEKSQAEKEKERLWQELQMVQGLCSEQTEMCRDISGALKGCEKELHHTHETNDHLQQHVLQLEGECMSLEDAHRHHMELLRREVESRVVPIVAQTYRGPPAASTEEVHEYARGLSEEWIETFDMYRHKVEEMERAIKADQEMLGDLQREKTLYASELDKLRAEAEKQDQVQLRLEEHMMHLQEKFQLDCNEYQMIIEQLEHERNVMAEAIAEKMREHQQLLQVKMDLGMEVAAYRALLEGERVGLQDASRRVAQHQRERVIDIRMPPQPYTPRASSLTTRQLMDIRYTPPTSSLRRSPVPPIGSTSPSRVIPITVTGRVQHQSPASRRDMISFTKAQAAMSSTATTTTTKDKPTGQRENQTNVPKMEIEKAEPIKQVPQEETQVSPIKSSTTEAKSVTVVSPPMMSLRERNETRSEKQVSDEKEKDKVYERDHKDNEKREPISPHEKKILDTVSLEEIIENVIKPAGIEAKVGSSGESKVQYHVEKTEQEDGKTKMQIVLESKVEEELDISEDSGLEELQNQRVKNVSLEDIKDTATGSMIKSLLSCLQESEDLGNKTINVEIIEEPGDSHSDEELEIERKSKSSFNEPTSTYFQIEELENVTHEPQRSDDDDAMKTSMTGTDNIRVGSVQVQDVSKESEISYFSHDQEPHDYFVSTPDDNFSEHEEGGGITSYGHYGMLDDLSDERYYQDDVILPQKVFVEESDEYNLPGGHSFVKESFSECIIEEEVCVSPVVQESVLELLKEDSLEPKEQLKGALEKLQSSVSGPLREELAFLTKVSSEGPQNVAVDVKKVQQSNDNGTMTIVAEMNVSQTLEDSGVLEAGDDLSEEQIMAALKSSDLGLDKAFQGGARGGYSFKISKEENVMYGEEFEDLADEGESALEITEKHLQLGPSEKSFTYQMDIQGSHAKASLEPEIQSQTLSTPVKRIATLILESPTND